MAEAEDPRALKDEQILLLKKQVQQLSEHMQVSGELMKVQNLQLAESRDTVQRLAEGLHHARQELALRDAIIARTRQRWSPRRVMRWLRSRLSSRMGAPRRPPSFPSP